MWRSGTVGQVKQSLWLIGATAIVIAGFVAAGGLSPLPAAVGFVALTVVILLATRTSRTMSRSMPILQAAAAKPGESQLQAVIDALPNPVVALDSAGVVVALNSPARAIWPALRTREPASLTLRMPALIEAVRRAVKTGEAQTAEISERIPVELWHEVQVIPFSLPSGPQAQSALLLLTFRDLTTIHRVEQMRADFVANASHELRTPLAAVSGFIDTLQGPARDDPAARERFLNIMQVQASRMARLIDDLLSLSRIELKEHINPETPTELGPIIRQVLDALQTLSREREIELTVAAPEEPLIVRGDRDELISLFENLVENALKYGALGKRVDIMLESAPWQEATSRAAKVSVRDYGPGIAPEHLPRLTERFYRIDVGQSRAEGGTGLGLALVKHIVNRHRGRLTIESTLGSGSTFTVFLPLIQNPQLLRPEKPVGSNI
jgi:two-component system, OmpR family, phosphate regulon sensor histidine kinase PhoR